MNLARQVAHIVRKDVRAYPLEIGLLLLLNLFLIVIATEPWSDNLLAGDDYINGAVEMVLHLAFVVIWCLLIAQVIQAETPTGKTSYGLTRPLSRAAVPAAKTAFVLLVVHLPIFAAQIIILIASGVPLSIPQLLLNQVVFLAYLSLPVMLVASLTRSLSQFVLAIVGVAAIVLMMQAGILGRANMPEVFGDLLDPIPLEVAAWMLVVGLVSGGALFWQYRRRHALVIASCCAGVVLLLYLITAAVPGNVEHVSRTLLAGTSTDVPEISFSPSAERPVIIESYPIVEGSTIGRSSLSLPMEVSKPENVEFVSVVVRVRMIDDRQSTFEIRGTGLRPGPNGYWVNVSFPQYFLDSELSIRIVIDSVQYEMRDGGAIPLDGRPAIVDGRAQCGLSLISDSTTGTIVCRSSFRPLEWVWVPGQRIAIATDYFQPFRFSMNPIIDDDVTEIRRPADDSATLATTLRLASGFLRQVVEIDRIRPEDWILQ